ncbi:N-formyl peptide receptor 2-like [Plakobranchus ocellatus]|uniref:Glycosyltransferase family 92 protein n=1 Tax=Plakobranchus ocellatus TaxID=259542 RepID=A0AAV3Z8Q3_9GAST|nr:N-formyl peptide receptor 2-like [Plakobranchus ocellatus]
MYHISTKWIVDMQSAEFSCSVSHDQLSALGLVNFTHMAVAQASCLEAPRSILPIQFPVRQSGTVGICLKVSYGSLDAARALEWMEYHRLMGVTTVFTYTWDLDPPVKAVFDYYVKLGFLQAVPAQPPPPKGGPARGFRRPRYEEQAWMDEIWASNDCKHRMFGLDFVVVMDMDEFIVPKIGLDTYHDILSSAQRLHPAAGGFQFDSHVFLLNWGPTRDSPLHIGRYTLRTARPNYDGVDRNSRWAFIPDRTYFVLNNLVVPRKPYTSEPVPNQLYTLYHYRSCKPNWKHCKTRPRLEDKSMLKHELRLVEKILGLANLDQLLYNDTAYVDKLRHWWTYRVT